MSVNTDFIQLNNGNSLPRKGLGTWQLQSDCLMDVLTAAAQVGYRHIDCAAIYKNEKNIGVELNKLFNTTYRRGDFFITSKLWNSHHQSQFVRDAFFKTLSDLKLEYLDLYLIHWPIAWRKDDEFPQGLDSLLGFQEAPLLDTWYELEKLSREGLVKNIGVSNFSSRNLGFILNSCDIKPSVNQIELHPYLQQTELISFCNKNDIAVIGYSPLGTPQYQESIKAPSLLQNNTVKTIAEKYNTNSAEILLRWGISKGAALIPKSNSVERVKSNFQSMSQVLDQESIRQIELLNCNLRYFSGSDWYFEGSPYTQEFLWGQ